MSAETRPKNRAALALIAFALAGASLAAVCALRPALGRSASSTFGAKRSALPAPNGEGNAGPELPSFAFRDQRGRVVDKRDLLGHVWIADFMYTSCSGACPLLTSRLVTMQRRLPDPDLRFVSFSVDPSGDSPQTLSRYAELWNAHESRWQLLSTDQAGLSRLTGSMQLELSRDGSDLVHSNRFFLVDVRGRVVASFDSSDDAALSRLLAEAGKLLGAPAAGTVIGDTGAELFASLGCNGCHGDPQLAPSLAGLPGTRVMLERGGNVLANDAYLHESIAEPSAKLVAGYPSSMPTYGAVLSSTQLDALVGYVRSLQGPPAIEPAQSSQIDPVCGMTVRVTKDTPGAKYQGQTRHFCSLACARLFQRDPMKYARAHKAASRWTPSSR